MVQPLPEGTPPCGGPGHKHTPGAAVVLPGRGAHGGAAAAALQDVTLQPCHGSDVSRGGWWQVNVVEKPVPRI